MSVKNLSPNFGDKIWRNIKNIEQIHRTHDMPSYIQYRRMGVMIEFIRFHKQQRKSNYMFPTTADKGVIRFEIDLDMNRKIFINNSTYSLPFFINDKGRQGMYDRQGHVIKL